MSKSRVMALTALAVFVAAGNAQALEFFESKKGIGFAQAIGGPNGLAFNYGLGNLDVEGILGLTQISPDEGDGVLTVGLGVGAHFAVLRAEQAAFTIGGRVNIGLGKDPIADESFTQIGVDIPMRVYWFPTKHFSIHTEFGVAIVMNPEKGAVWGTTAGPKGMDVSIFGNPTNAGTFGNLGLTFWW